MSNQKTTAKSITIQYLPFPEEADKSRVMEAGKFLFPKFGRTLEVHCKPIGDRWLYSTGLEAENYPEDEQEEVRQAKADLEKYFGKGMLEPTNEEFWKKIKLEITRTTTFLDLNVPEDKLTYYIIKGGGFGVVAPSYDAAISGAIPKRWYLVDINEFSEIGAEDDRKIIKAFAALNELEESKSFDEMFLIHKVLVSSDRGTTKNSPKAMLFKDLSDFLNGRIVKTNKRQIPKQFLDAFDLLKKDKKKLFVTAYVKEAIYFNFLHLGEDNQFKNLQTGTKYGSAIDKIVSYLANPANQSELDNIRERVEQKWKE